MAGLDDSKIMDVSKPGKGKIVPTSRPVVTSTPVPAKPEKEEPSPLVPAAEEAPAPTPAPSTSHKVIQPLNDLSKDAEPDEAAPEAVEKEQAADSSVMGETSDAASVEALAGSVESKKEAAKKAEEQAKKDAELQALIDSKQYVVPVGQGGSTGSKKWLLTIVAGVLSLFIAGYLLIDAGAFGSNIKLPFEFFKDDSSQSSALEMVNNSTVVPKSVERVDSTLSKYEEHNISFSYPKTWEVAQQVDPNRPDIDLITLTSQPLTQSVATEGGEDDIEVKLRLEIYAENTTDKETYPTGFYNLQNCTSETFRLENEKGDFQLALLSTGSETKYHTALLNQSGCYQQEGMTIVDDQIQFANKKNTFLIQLNYIFTEKGLIDAGGEVDDLYLYNIFGVQLTKEAFTSPDAYSQAVSIIKSMQGI